jgi:hypothetical protein
LAGDFVSHNQQDGLTKVEGQPVLLRISVDSLTSDTLAIRADHIFISEDDIESRFQAHGAVNILQDNLAAVADSAMFRNWQTRPVTLGDSASSSTETGHDRASLHLFRGPIAWFGDTQLNGDTLVVLSSKTSADTLQVFGNAFVAKPDSATGLFQQVQGQRLFGVFVDDSLRSIRVGPNAEAIYFRTDSDSGELEDAVRMSADEIVLSFADGEVSQVRALSGIEGTYYEPDVIPENMQLGKFLWEPERRPGSSLTEAILDRLNSILGPTHGFRDLPSPATGYPDNQ